MTRTQAITTHGTAFPDDFFLPDDGLLWQDRNWRQNLDAETARKKFGYVRRSLQFALRNLADRQQPRATARHLLSSLSELFGWKVGERKRMETDEGEEEAGYPISVDGDEPVLFVRCLAPDALFDAPPEGHHRRFSPTLVMERVLLAEGMTVGILLNGTALRLLRCESGQRSWVEVNLTAIAEGFPDGEKAWQFLWAFLRNEALKGRLLWKAIEEARMHALKVGEDLGKQIQEALRLLLQALLDHPENQAYRPDLEQSISQLYQEGLRFLYRLLFVLYAEAKSLLPLDLPVYHDGYSLTRWVKWAFDRRNLLTDHDTFLEQTLRALFQLLWEGADLGPHGKIPAYKGNLFDPTCMPFLENLRIGDKTLAEVLIRLAYRQTPQGWRRVSYRNLAVEHIGSVYETLMEYSPVIATEPMWEVEVNGQREVLTKAQLEEVLQRRLCVNPDALSDDPYLASLARRADRLQKSVRILNRLPKGTIYFRAGFRRKQTGTYFTHPALVDFLVRQSLQPLVGRVPAPEEILSLKIVDPAMGSGHFLVAACRFLAQKLLDAYRQQFAQVMNENPDLPESEALTVAAIPRPVAAVWQDEWRALTACKLLIASHCLYGVDKNPLAVDLAKVTLWIETAAADQPLTFLDHRFKVGDSLLGVPLKRLLPEGLFTNLLRQRLQQAFQHLQTITELVSDDPANLDALRKAHKAMESELEPFWQLHQIAIGSVLSEGEAPNDPNREDEDLAELSIASKKRKAKSILGSKLSGQSWHNFLRSGELDQALQVGEPLRQVGEQNHAFSWELAFPDVFFNPDGTPKENPGFDVVLGNPPWDKVKPQELEFYSDYDPLIGEYQGQVRKDRIRELHRLFPKLEQEWNDHAKGIKKYAEFLTKSGVYRYQFATLCSACSALLPEKICQKCGMLTPLDKKCAFCGKSLFPQRQPIQCPNCNAGLREAKAIHKTSGDPDLYRFFTERAYQIVREGGLVGFLLPAAFYATEGATALRRLLLDKSQLQACFSFENRWRLFPIDIRYKFATVVFRKGGQTEEFPAAFMLHDPEFLSLPDTHPERLRREVRLTRPFLERTSPGYRLFLEVKNALEYRLAERLHQKFPRLGQTVAGAWQVSFTREVDMTNDSYLFRTAEQLEQNLAVRQEPDAASRRGGILYRTPDAETYRQKGYRVVRVPEFDVEVALPEDALKGQTEAEIEAKLREELSQTRRRQSRFQVPNPRSLPTLREILTRGFVCDDNYVPLYEGRMVHQFDPAAKAYVSGEGKKQVWEHLDWHEKHLHPHYFVSAKLFAAMFPGQQRFRAGFLGVNSATNERTLQSAVVPSIAVCGNAVPTVSTAPDDPRVALLWAALANSFISDWLIRVRVKENLNFVFIAQLPMPRLSPDGQVGREMVVLSARLNCVLPEFAELWEQVAQRYPDDLSAQWRLPQDRNDPDFDRLPCIDPTERQFLRARLDALAADAYGLTAPEFAYILTTFPLLDRDQPPLEGEEQSTVTRDLALCAYMLHKGWQPSPFGKAHPEFHQWLCEKLGITNSSLKATSTETIPYDLAAWFTENVPEAQVPKMGEIRDLEKRLYVAIKTLNAVAYIPTRGEQEEETA